MSGATLRVLQVEWERAWMSEDFNAVTRIDNARKIIEGLRLKGDKHAYPTHHK